MGRSKLFSTQVVVAHASPDMWGADIYPEERYFVSNVARKRYREFSAGRLCAREVLKILGVNNYPLLVGENREPIWPPGIIGSISHCNDDCIVVASSDKPILGLGVDVEGAASLSDDVKAIVCRNEEEQWIDAVSTPDCPDWAKIIFSAKESVYKCLYPATNICLDFKDVEIALDVENNEFSVGLFNSKASKLLKSHSIAGRFYYTNEYVYTGVELRKTR